MLQKNYNLVNRPLSIENISLQKKNISGQVIHNLPTFALRRYQQDCINAIKSFHQKGEKRLLISLPTGAGKTVIFSYLINELGSRTLILCHTHELQAQAVEKLKSINPEMDIGIVNGQYKEFDHDVVVALVQAAYQNIDLLKGQNLDVVIYDECHHAVTDGSRNLLNQLGCGKTGNKLLIGFTATAFRLDGKGLGEVFDVIAYQKGTKELITEGWLVQPRGVKILTDIDISSVIMSGEDLDVISLSKIMDTQGMNTRIVEAYISNAYGLQAICFTTTVQHAQNVAFAFNARGITADVVYGDMPASKRAFILQQYKIGKIKVLCNCAVLTEGFDAPETGVIVIARPTKSPGLYQQMVGRGLRPFQNKNECIVLDFGDTNHTLCDLAVLLNDAEELSIKTEPKKRTARLKLPKNIDPELRSIFREYDLFDREFLWQRTRDSHVMRGSDGIYLEITQSINGTYLVTFVTAARSSVIGSDLGLEQAFDMAEKCARENRNLFPFSDRNAAWAKELISEKQIDIFRKNGFTKGVRHLTKGQASLMISSGMLKRKAKK